MDKKVIKGNQWAWEIVMEMEVVILGDEKGHGCTMEEMSVREERVRP